METRPEIRLENIILNAHDYVLNGIAGRESCIALCTRCKSIWETKAYLVRTRLVPYSTPQTLAPALLSGGGARNSEQVPREKRIFFRDQPTAAACKNCCGMLAVVIARFLLSLLLIKITSAEVPSWMYKSILAASEQPVLAPAIESDPEGKAALRTILEYYKDIERNMTRVRATTADIDLLDKPIPDYLQLYGWPKMNESQSMYLPGALMSTKHPLRRRLVNEAGRLREEKRKLEVAERTVFKAFVALGKALDSRPVARLVKRLISRRKGSVSQWQHVFHPNRLNYSTETGSHRCIVRSNLAYRVNGTWSITVVTTNDGPASHRRDKERMFQAEMLYFATSGRLDFQPLFFDLNRAPNITLKYWGDRPVSVNRTLVSTTVFEFAARLEWVS